MYVNCKSGNVNTAGNTFNRNYRTNELVKKLNFHFTDVIGLVFYMQPSQQIIKPNREFYNVLDGFIWYGGMYPFLDYWSPRPGPESY